METITNTPELRVKYKNAAQWCSQALAIKKFTADKENQLCENANLGTVYK